MNRTKIEWTDFTWNPVTGCRHGCQYCYARRIASRFRNLFPNGFEPTFHPERLDEPFKVPRSFRSRNPNLPEGSAMIFTVSMGDLFGGWVSIEWIYPILNVVRSNPHHIFQFLTKNPYRLKEFPFTPNTWVGATVDWVTTESLRRARVALSRVSGASVRFVSLEPFLHLDFLVEAEDFEGFDWVIIGAQTNPYRPPEKEWVRRVVKLAHDAGAAVFLKDNLNWPERIQEFPTPKEVAVRADQGA
ncbi:DUF5131 family protein [Geoglobus ahangari]